MLQRFHKYFLPYQPYKFLFGSIPSITEAEKRWALFQILLSFVFFFVVIAIGFLTIDISTVSGGIMIIAFICFGLGLLALIYAFGIGLYWFTPKHPINNDEETRRAERDDRLHEDIQSLIKQIADLAQKMRERNG